MKIQIKMNLSKFLKLLQSNIRITYKVTESLLSWSFKTCVLVMNDRVFTSLLQLLDRKKIREICFLSLSS